MTKLRNTLLSYPDRGPWGSGEFRGNASGYMVRDLIDTYGVKSVLDPMAGSGTTKAVCASIGLGACLSYDIRDGLDILISSTQKTISLSVDEVTDMVGIDMVFLHPPYWNMIQYTDRSGDFSRGTYQQWIDQMTAAMKFLGTQLSPRGFIALLLADLRNPHQPSFDHPKTYFLTDDATSDAVLYNARLEKEIRYIDVQHNASSGGDVGLEVNLTHQYLTILRSRGYNSNISNLHRIKKLPASQKVGR